MIKPDHAGIQGGQFPITQATIRHGALERSVGDGKAGIGSYEDKACERRFKTT